MIFQEINWIRSNIDKFSPSLRKQALEWYRPFRFVPCFLQKKLKALRQRIHKLPVIVQLQTVGEYRSYTCITAKSAGCKIKRDLSSINSFSAKVNAKTLEKLVKDNNVRKVWYDDVVKAVLDIASPAVKAPVAWNSSITGKGIGIAVIDTGIYPHDDLSGRIIAFKDLVNKKAKPYDDNGHGTHVAGDIASDGSQYKGTAPAAYVIGVKVLNKLGSGRLSTVIDGIQWCIENKNKYFIRVINLSLGSPASVSYADDPVCQAAEAAWNSGIVVCAAAGNEGPEKNTIASPGIHPSIITVGAMDDNNSLDFDRYEVASFSSRGPTVDGLVKPDLLSPGTNIISLRSPKSTLDKQNKGSRVGAKYASLSGTSMAAPVCSGIVALMLEANGRLTPDSIKEILKSTSRPIQNANENAQGKGVIDAEAAINYIFRVNRALENMH
ncbi:MAG: S8 family peptidase [Bacillota bacterium]